MVYIGRVAKAKIIVAGIIERIIERIIEQGALGKRLLLFNP